MNRFRGWTTAALSSQSAAQAREQLDPEYTEFMDAVSERLANLDNVVAASKRCVGVLNALSERGVLPEHEAVSGALVDARAALASVLP